MRRKSCVAICNNRWGYCATPHAFKSIADAVRWARSSGWFWYRIVCDGRVVRRGFGDE